MRQKYVNFHPSHLFSRAFMRVTPPETCENSRSPLHGRMASKGKAGKDQVNSSEFDPFLKLVVTTRPSPKKRLVALITLRIKHPPTTISRPLSWRDSCNWGTTGLGTKPLFEPKPGKSSTTSEKCSHLIRTFLPKGNSHTHDAWLS